MLAGTGKNVGAPLPVTLLTGFLGAGKTTLVNRILTERASERIAVLVNEYGDVPVDGRLVVRSEEEVVELANGCVCCTVRGDLVRALARVLERRPRRGQGPLRRVLVETSGLASPGPVLQTLRIEPSLATRVRSAGVLTLVHAALIVQQLERHPEAAEQVGYADRVVLNHLDRAGEDGRAAAEAAVLALNPGAELLAASHARVPVAAVLAEPEGNAPRQHAAAREHAHGDAGTVVLRTHRALELPALKMWLQFLCSRREQDLWRVKGVLRCRDHADSIVVQGVYQFLELGPGSEAAPEESVLVLIGRDLARDELERGWAACGG